MKCVCVTFILLALVTGGQAAAGDVGEACKTGDTCTNSNVYCNTNKVCTCYPGWVRSGSKCLRGATQTCGNSQCLAGLVCLNNACACDNVGIGYAPGSADATTCSCPPNYSLRPSDKKCAKVIGQMCSANSDCIDNAICDGGTKKCVCDTSKHFSAGSDGASTCSCDSTKAELDSAGVCKLKTGETCSVVGDCINTKGMTCSSGKKCACDTSKGYAAGNNGVSTCACSDANTASDTTGTCRLKLGQSCSVTPCMTTPGMICATDNEKCACNTATGYAAGNDGDSSCSCKGDAMADSDGVCKFKTGQVCSATLKCITTPGMVCSSGGKCVCDSTKGYAAGSDGQNKCSCDSSSTEMNAGVCKFKVGKGCSDTLPCLPGLICLNGKCACNTTKGLAAGNDGDTTCSCAKSEAHIDPVDGTCRLKVEQSCSMTSQCLASQGMVCLKGKCSCDTSNGFLSGSSGATTCSCSSSTVEREVSGMKFCGKKVGGACQEEKADDVCTASATCKATTGVPDLYTCQCPGSHNTDMSCSDGAGNFASLAVLMATLMFSSRFI